MVPAAPAVSQATCTNGAVTAPAILLADTPGITYTRAPDSPYDGTKDATVIVTATLADGYEWGQMPDGWTRQGPVRATFVGHVDGRRPVGWRRRSGRR